MYRTHNNNRELHILVRCTAVALALACSSCTFLPSSGPSASRIRKDAATRPSDNSYQLVKLEGQNLQTLKSFNPKPSYLSAGGRELDTLFRNRGIQNIGDGHPLSILAGDIIEVHIFETGGGLFSPLAGEGQSGGSPITRLPPQRIDGSGEITIPYVGRLKAIGKAPGELEAEIKEKLREKTVEPQVIVGITTREGGDLISVGGDVKRASQIPVSQAGTRLIDAITAAGGTDVRPHQTMVSVTRNHVTRADSLQDVYDRPEKNIQLQPGDTVLLRNRPLTFLVFGAGGKVGNFPIDIEDLSLAEALARSGGPRDLQANPGAIFIYRLESSSFLKAIGREPLLGSETHVPVIYQLELQDPSGFFLAKNFLVRDKDIIYYSTAGSVGVTKFMGLINTFLAPAMGTAGAASSATILAQ